MRVQGNSQRPSEPEPKTDWLSVLHFAELDLEKETLSLSRLFLSLSADHQVRDAKAVGREKREEGEKA